MHKNITSFQNPLIKQIVLLQDKSRERRKLGLFIIEGMREISLAIKGGYLMKTLLFCSEIISEEEVFTLKESANSETEFIEISSEIYEKLAYRGSTEGVLAIAHTKDLNISKLVISAPLNDRSQSGAEGLLILIAEAPEKPGNIGALLRTADAAKVDAVIIANPKTDMYNPNIIRSSVGCLFTNKVATGSTSEIISFLKENNINIYCAALQASLPYHTCDFKKSTAIVVGTEATGLSDEWLQNSTQNIIIPMQGEIDSMNVSVAAGILIFEAKRQRGF
ncbi:TrmH family RNA methyltransferase [Aequorivita vladivostokensis]|uniref:rRNA methyltransferase n=1 Tax=Aequorivita vladivostokensis TaxID=171194 RepID=A0ABR5DL38_9FLAO|nr:RNA methyltransferase [Aequorivita vladivostokensis]KJJ39494.1 rRNA methyltransferase [Aequorivita vladivostokensis]MBF31470.1 RNA methyltransferase [Aequorivita sp.]HAV54837.1 RNA methyltransferase [Aequorivita sp.]HBL78875.1 RNA methyltransferase [Aequorivita sp.]|tara:strand:+ start:129524 stop:130357 length:834 start_codon:yes stop_codon:yes gene_type:complete